MASSLFVNILLGSLGLVEVIRNQHRITETTITLFSTLCYYRVEKSWKEN